LTPQSIGLARSFEIGSPAISMILGRSDVGMSEIQGHKSNAIRSLNYIKGSLHSSSSRLRESHEIPSYSGTIKLSSAPQKLFESVPCGMAGRM
jgi:hypothetical protein